MLTPTVKPMIGIGGSMSFKDNKYLGLNMNSVWRGLWYGSAIGIGFVLATIIEEGVRTGHWFVSPTGPWSGT